VEWWKPGISLSYQKLSDTADQSNNMILSHASMQVSDTGFQCKFSECVTTFTHMAGSHLLVLCYISIASCNSFCGDVHLSGFLSKTSFGAFGARKKTSDGDKCDICDVFVADI